MRKPLLGAFIGVGVATVLAGVAMVAAGAGHGTYLPAKLFFPYSMMAAALGGSIGYFALALALLQGVSYGSVATAARNRRVAVGMILALHAVAVLVTLATASDSF